MTWKDAEVVSEMSFVVHLRTDTVSDGVIVWRLEVFGLLPQSHAF